MRSIRWTSLKAVLVWKRLALEKCDNKALLFVESDGGALYEGATSLRGMKLRRKLLLEVRFRFSDNWAVKALTSTFKYENSSIEYSALLRGYGRR